MYKDKLAITCQKMAVFTLLLIVAMVVINAATWFFPSLGSIDGGYGIAFSLSNQLIPGALGVVDSLPIWQRLGAVVISSIPLLVLARGLLSLRALFTSYANGDYFSAAAATHMEKMGRAVGYWVILNFVCEPLLSLWVTMLEPAGQRFISMSFTSSSIVALFVSACVIIIARILRRAASINQENQQFV